jgi:hypothetical protein
MQRSFFTPSMQYKATILISFSGSGKLISAANAYEALHRRYRDTLNTINSNVDVLKTKLLESHRKQLEQRDLLVKYEEALDLIKSEFTYVYYR